MRKVITVVIVLLMMYTCGCNVQRSMQTEPESNDIMLDLAAQSNTVSVPHTVSEDSIVEVTSQEPSSTAIRDTYTRVIDQLQGIHFQTERFDLIIDATVERPDAETLPAFIVVPRYVRELEEELYETPHGWTWTMTKDGYVTHYSLRDPQVSFEWNIDDSNRWENASDYVGGLTEANAIDKAYEWAARCGFEEVTVAETRAYGKATGEGFRSVILQTYHDGVGITMENIVQPQLYGQHMVFMLNEVGFVNIQMQTYEFIHEYEGIEPLIPLEGALTAFKESVDTVSEADEGAYIIQRIALEYVPVEENEFLDGQKLVPAWTFTSAMNDRTNYNIVIWIDARTKEVLSQTKKQIPTEESSSKEENLETIIYHRISETLDNVQFQTKRYNISIDAAVEHVDAETLPDIIVSPHTIEDPGKWLISGNESHFNQIDYISRFLSSTSEDHAWDVSPDNRWENADEYTGLVSEAETIAAAYIWAKRIGFDEVSVIESRAYGKTIPNASFRWVLLQSYRNGIAITPEAFVSEDLVDLHGEQMVFMINDNGSVCIKALTADICEYVENPSPLISLSTALSSWQDQIDSISDVVSSDHTIKRIALEYVPVSRSESNELLLIPAWTFTSKVNYATNKNMVAWVDARTGEVIK